VGARATGRQDAAVDRALASAVAHRWHPVAAPVSDENLRLLVARLTPDDGRLLDLGCGFGEWLRTALTVVPGGSGVGVDLSEPALVEARRRAAGLGERLRFERADVTTWAGGSFDAVLCVGVSHAFGGLGPTLDAVRGHLRPGGRVLLGDAFWEATPGPEALDAIGDLPSIGGLLDRVQEHGFQPGFAHISTAAEWDRYEWSWTGALTEWALEEADDEALELARTHRREWLAGYRGQLGFLTVVLHDRNPGLEAPLSRP
jgi:cyclopropane fatty-acyl-phospholipid synthase-like methyltransferase